MPGTECIIEELALYDALKEYEKVADAAESIKWGDLGLSVLTAWGGAILGALSTKGSPPGIAAGAAPGLIGAYRTIMKDIEERPAANAAAEAVEEAFNELQECREDHKDENGEDPFGDAPLPSLFDDMPVIPYAEPDPDPEVNDDEIIIFDEEDIEVMETEDGDIIIIEDE